MKITLFNIGKTDSTYLQQGISEYVKRLVHFIDFNIVDIPAVKTKAGNNPDTVKNLEAKAILKATKDVDIVILLDEKGKAYSSMDFSKWLSSLMNRGLKHVAFVSGGAWGFSDEIYRIAQAKISLSEMTFTHQMVRLFFTEQLYRAFTIIKGMPYHNQ